MHLCPCMQFLCVFLWTAECSLKKKSLFIHSFFYSPGQICNMSSSDLTHWNLPKHSILWAFPVLSPSDPSPYLLTLGPSPCRWIKDQMRHLSSDHFNSHLASGADKEQKTVGSFFFLLSPCSLPLCKMYLKENASSGHFRATLGAVFLMMSKTSAGEKVTCRGRGHWPPRRSALPHNQSLCG